MDGGEGVGSVSICAVKVLILYYWLLDVSSMHLPNCLTESKKECFCCFAVTKRLEASVH